MVAHKHTRRKSRRWSIPMGLAILALGGCSTVTPFGRPSAVVDSATTYQNGRASRVFPGESTAQMVEPAKKAMMDIGVQGITQMPDGNRVILEGKTADNRRATVWVAPQGTGVQVSNRVGLFGDEPLSRAFIDRLAVQVGPPTGETPEIVGSAKSKAKPKGKPAGPTVDDDVQTASGEKSGRFSRDAVSDSTMLRDQAPIGYKDSPIP